MSTQSIENSLIDLVAPQAAIAVVFTCAHAAAQQEPTPLSRKMVPTGSLAGGGAKNRKSDRHAYPRRAQTPWSAATVETRHNKRNGAAGEAARLSETVMSGLDQNWKGFASREGYIRSRSGGLNAGQRGAERHVWRDQRFYPRFKAADRKSDGLDQRDRRD